MSSQIPQEVVFAFRMLMLKYNLSQVDISRILVELNKTKK